MISKTPTTDHNSPALVIKRNIPLPSGVLTKDPGGCLVLDAITLENVLTRDYKHLIEAIEYLWRSTTSKSKEELQFQRIIEIENNSATLSLRIVSLRSAIADEQQELFDDTTTALATILDNATNEFVRIMQDYFTRCATDTVDLPICFGKSERNDPKAIWSENKGAIDAAKRLILSESRSRTVRPVVTISTDSRNEASIPPALQRDAQSVEEGIIIVDGKFDDISYNLNHAKLRATDGPVYNLTIEKSLLIHIDAAQYLDVEVRAIIHRKIHQIAGAEQFATYVLIDFDLIQSDLFQQNDTRPPAEVLKLHNVCKKADGNT